jgi:hypothetical protein
MKHKAYPMSFQKKLKDEDPKERFAIHAVTVIYRR